MLFSCKISNTFINYLDKKGEDLSFLFENSPLSLELLTDPSYWISAPDLENWLQSLVQKKFNFEYQDLITEVGHATPDLHAWGVLDSVLKMMKHPGDILIQPEKFLAYFISPEPPIENLKKSDSQISFDLPLTSEQYPMISKYLKAAFEALPKYTGNDLAQCDWHHISIQIQWSEPNTKLFNDQSTMQLSPQLLQNIIQDLQKNQKDLEEKNRELMKINHDFLSAQTELKKKNSGTDESKNQIRLQEDFSQILSQDSINQINQVNQFNQLDKQQNNIQSEEIYRISQNMARLHDYMVRAQQLITMLSSQVKMNAGLKEAMRRMDWDYVKSQYPKTISESVESLRKLKKEI